MGNNSSTLPEIKGCSKASVREVRRKGKVKHNRGEKLILSCKASFQFTCFHVSCEFYLKKTIRMLKQVDAYISWLFWMFSILIIIVVVIISRLLCASKYILIFLINICV